MQKHRTTIILLVLYYLWFAYVGWHMVKGLDNEAEGLRMITMIIISVALGGIYLCVFLFKILVSKETAKENYLFIWLITLPMIMGGIYKILQ